MIVWVLTDYSVGNNTQAIVVAEKLSRYYIIKKVTYNFFAKLPNFIRRDTLIGINKKESSNLTDELPDVVVCAGKKLSSVALHIKKLSHGRTFIINIKNPHLPCNKFDTLIFPNYDFTSKNILKKYNNIIEVYGSLNEISKDKIKSETEKFKPFFKRFKRPFVSFIVGGDTKNCKYDPKNFGIMVSNLSNIINKEQLSLFIATSRRTSRECTYQIRRKTNCDHYLYDWGWECDSRNIMKSELGNPYYAMLGLSDFFVVTGDSISILSEVCSTGKPVYVYMPKSTLSEKHYNFCNQLLKDGYIKKFNKNTINFEKYEYKPLSELDRITKIILEKMKNN